MTTIVLADDHPVVRSGTKATLERTNDLKILAEAGDGQEALRLVAELNPDVLIADMMMPNLTGLELARQVSQQHPHTRVIILSMHADEQYVLEALRNGAVGYLLKEDSAEELIDAVREVANGQRHLSSSLKDRVIELFLMHSSATINDAYDLLSNREREVLKLSAEGFNNTEIGERLFISSRTVESHRNNLMRKLNLNNQTELIRYAIKRGMI